MKVVYQTHKASQFSAGEGRWLPTPGSHWRLLLWAVLQDQLQHFTISSKKTEWAKDSFRYHWKPWGLMTAFPAIPRATSHHYQVALGITGNNAVLPQIFQWFQSYLCCFLFFTQGDMTLQTASQLFISQLTVLSLSATCFCKACGSHHGLPYCTHTPYMWLGAYSPTTVIDCLTPF